MRNALMAACSLLLVGLAACGSSPPAECVGCADAGADVTSDAPGTTCPPHAQWVDGVCECFPGYAGDGCATCAPGYTLLGGLCAPGCGPDTCSGHGTCSMVGGAAVCACEPGWAAPFCDVCERGFAEQGGACVDLCAGRDCGGRGICDAWSGYAICLCDQGWIGQDCESCAPYYGHAGGECVEACQPDSCSGHGWCDGYTGEPVCECYGLYEGADCSACPLGWTDTGDECLPVCEVTPCNNAACDGSTGSAVCTCYDTYEGADCGACAAAYQDLGGGVCGANVVGLEADLNRTCALFDNGTMRCWGADDGFGKLGYPGVERVGCEALPVYEAGAVDIAGFVTQVATGSSHTCWVLDDGTVHCFGGAGSGVLGYGNDESIGDDEPVDSGGAIAVGGVVASVAAGNSNTCVVLAGGAVRCWGWGASLFASENSQPVGDDELPTANALIDLGGAVAKLELGAQTGCALRADGGVRCWGSNGFGVLGAGVPGAWFDPTKLSDVPLPDLATDIAVGDWHACAVVTGGSLYCWGLNSDGRLGYGHVSDLGKAETPTEVGPVNVGGPVDKVFAGDDQTCAILTTGALRCWGASVGGKLGYPAIDENIGDDEVPADVGDIALPAKVADVAIGDRYTCALMETGAVRCWGENGWDCALGTAGVQGPGGNSADPATAADVKLFYGP